jgi:hypothetical protein
MRRKNLEIYQAAVKLAREKRTTGKSIQEKPVEDTTPRLSV